MECTYRRSHSLRAFKMTMRIENPAYGGFYAFQRLKKFFQMKFTTELQQLKVIESWMNY